MLTDKQIADALDLIDERYHGVITKYLQKVGKTIKEIGHLSQSSINLLIQLRRMGVDTQTIERELQNAMITEIATEKIGEMVMAHLRTLDAVSYVRFASVYREFKDADTFLEEINKVIRGDKKEKKGKC